MATTSLRSSSDPADPDDVLRVCAQEEFSSDGFRLLWYHSLRKAERDEAARVERSVRATRDLEALRQRLAGPRSRLRERELVEQAVAKILAEQQVEGLWRVEILEQRQDRYRQVGRGRPTQDTAYRRETTRRFDLRWTIDDPQWQLARRDDGVFPLLTNDRALTPREVLAAYKRQPQIEKRFAQLKSDYDIAPVFLKSPSRVVGLFTVYYFALLVQALLERDLRRALEHHAAAALPDQQAEQGAIALYPEGRLARRPTARRILDALEPLRRHELTTSQAGADDEPTALHDQLNSLQRRLLKLLNLDPDTYGR